MRFWKAGSDRKQVDRSLAWLLLLIAGLICRAQSHPVQSAGYRNLDPRAVVSSAAFVPAHILRDIKDPHTGAHWLILPNTAAPAGPGRMVPAPEGSRSAPIPGREKISPIMQPGDRVVIEEHTLVAEAYLEGVALGPAVAGSKFDVRLKCGGKVVRVVAIAPGRAALIPSEVQP